MKEISYTWYCLLGTLIYLGISVFICKFTLNFGDYFTNCPFFENFYYRGMVYSEYIPFGQLIYYWIMLPIGFTFVNLVNLRNERKNPFLDNHLSYKSFIQTVTIVAPAFFFISAIVALRGQHDLDGYCQSGVSFKREVRMTGDPFFDSLPQDEEPSCKTYTLYEVFHYNYFVWTVGYFIGLQFTHMDQGIM